MLRTLSLSTALFTTSLLLLGCPPDQPGDDAGTPAVDGGDEDDDAGTTDEGCGDITAAGQCDGAEVSFCDTETDTVISYSCDDTALFPDATTQCSEVTTEYGVDCTVAAGGECAYFDEEGSFVWILCRGSEPACFEENNNFSCVENAGTCDESDIGTCQDDNLVWSCTATQPFLIDCASYGGTCGATEQACVGLPVGAICDGDLYQCAAGLDCQVGECVDATPVDAGTSDAGDGEEDAGAGDDDAGAGDAG